MKQAGYFYATCWNRISASNCPKNAFEEINANPALSAGKYYAYQAPEAKLTPVPEGYAILYFHDRVTVHDISQRKRNTTAR